jgi:hypothetical protein
MKDLQRGFPDQGKWCQKFAAIGAGGRLMSAQDVMTRLEFTEALELFTMRACLYGGSYIQNTSAKAIQSRVDGMKKYNAKIRRVAKMWAHPEVALRNAATS